MHLKRRELVIAFSLLALILIAFFYRSFILGEVFTPAKLLADYVPWKGLSFNGTANPLRSDDVFLFFPQLHTHFSMVLRGEWPWWDMTRLAGTPAFWSGVNLGQLLYPLSVLFLFPPLGDRLILYAVLRLLIAGMGLYLFLRQVRVSHQASLLGAVVFMLNGFFIVWLSSAFPTVWVWLPWALLFTERILKKPSFANTSLLSLCVGFQLLGGYVALSFIFLVFWGLFAFYRLIQEGMSQAWSPKGYLFRILPLGMAGIGAVLVGSLGIFPMLATLSGAPLSGRASGVGAYPIFNMITYLWPNFFGNPAHGNWFFPAGNYCENVTYLGLIPLFLALCSVLLKPRHRLMPFFFGMALFSLLYMYGFPLIHEVGWLPGFRQTLFTRWNSVYATTIPTLAAFGWEALLEQSYRLKVRLWVGFSLVASLAVAVSFFVALPFYRQRGMVSYELGQIMVFACLLLLFSLVIGLLFKAPKSFSLAYIATFLIVLTDLSFAGVTFNPTVPKNDFYPATPGIQFLQAHAKGSRVVCYDQILKGDIPGIYGFEALTGYDVFGDHAYRHYLYQAGDRSLAPEQAITANDYIEAVSDRGWPSVNELHFNLDPKSPLLGRLAARYFLVPPTKELKDMPLVYEGSDLRIYQNPSFCERAWFVPSAQYVQDEARMFELLRGQTGEPRQVLLSNPPPFSTDGNATGSVVIEQLRPDRILLTAISSGPGYVVVAERFDPRWKAFMDGQPVAVLKGDALLRAIPVGAGKHSILFSYQDPVAQGTFWLSLASMLGLFALGLGTKLWALVKAGAGEAH